MKFVSNIFVFVAIAASAAAESANTVESIDDAIIEETTPSSSSTNLRSRCRRVLGEDGVTRNLCSCWTYYENCSRCGTNERCQYRQCPSDTSGSFQQCACKSGYTKINGYCAGADGKSCTADVYCTSGSCVDGVCGEPAASDYTLLAEKKKCGLVNDAKRLAWDVGTTASCAEMVADDDDCSDIFMVKRSSDDTEDGTQCNCVQTWRDCSLMTGTSWNTFQLN